VNVNPAEIGLCRSPPGAFGDGMRSLDLGEGKQVSDFAI